MKSLTERLLFEVPDRRCYLYITETVAGLVRKSGVKEGLCLVNAMHLTPCVAFLSFVRKLAAGKTLCGLTLRQL
jgi:thiamine phosphate synthase YjbQ (UPF0047 family)